MNRATKARNEQQKDMARRIGRMRGGGEGRGRKACEKEQATQDEEAEEAPEKALFLQKKSRQLWLSSPPHAALANLQTVPATVLQMLLRSLPYLPHIEQALESCIVSLHSDLQANRSPTTQF